MPLVLKDRVQETTTTTGTGTITLAGAVAGFQSFSVIGDGNTTYYTITSPTDFEVGIGTYTAAGTLLSRDTILESSNSGSAVDFAAGVKTVFVTYPADKSSVTFSAGSRTANYTASINEGVLTDTSGSSFTVTLPASPIAGSQVVISDSGNAWGTNNLTVARNGETIGGLAENLVCDISGASITLIYDGASWEVFSQIGGGGGNAVTLNGTQTLTNKTIDIASNTLTGVVSLTGTQTLTNKTIRQMTQIISTNTNADASNIYVMTASLTLTLPSTPSAGDWVSFSNRSETITPVIARNGQNIMGLAEDMTIDDVNASGTLVYADSTRGWVFVE
jgi:hypothetical protein